MPLQSPNSTGRSKRFEDTLELKRATVRTALVLAEGRVIERSPARVSFHSPEGRVRGDVIVVTRGA